MVEDEMAAGGMVENESVLLKKADDLTRFDRGGASALWLSTAD
jgi:hypothetical protein